MTVPIGVLVVADYFDSIYAQVRVRPRVSKSVYVCFLHCYYNIVAFTHVQYEWNNIETM